MRTISIRRLAIILPTISLVLFVAAERLNILKSDSIAAAACATGLFAGKPDAPNLIAQSSAAISVAAARYDLPPEMLAAIIYGHQRSLTPYRRFTDCAGSALGADLSVGLAQIRISTAMQADGLDPDAASPREFKAYRSSLLDPTRNVHYEAGELRSILERANRFPGVTSDALIHDPVAMALVMSEYRAGRQDADRDDMRLSANALWDLQHMLEDTVYIFDRPDADAVQIQRGIRAYLDERYCNGEIFNDSACASWRGSVADAAPLAAILEANVSASLTSSLP